MDKFDTPMWGRWALTFIGFPLAGLAAKGATGPIDSATAAVVGGLAAGAVLGGVQSLALRVSGERRLAWAGATAIGMAAGHLGRLAPTTGPGQSPVLRGVRSPLRGMPRLLGAGH